MLVGKLVRLRAIDREDIPTFVRWFNDPEVRHFLQMFEPMSRAGEERWFEAHLIRQDEYLFAIEAPVDSGWLNIGNAGLHRVDWKNRGVTFGIVLGEKAFWGKGFGTDATRTMLRFAFDELNLHRVELEVYDFNPRAMRCYEKAGFRLEGTRRQAHFHQGAYHDVHCMGILRDEFHHD
jgi:diamine N-acetyltransferase